MALFRASTRIGSRSTKSVKQSAQIFPWHHSTAFAATETTSKCIDDIAGGFKQIEYGNREQLVEFTKQHQTAGIYTFTQSDQRQIGVFAGSALQDAYKLDGKGSTHNMWPESWQMILGEHSMTLKYGSDHRRIRKVLAPLFTESSLKHRFDLIQSVTAKFVEPLIQRSEDSEEYVHIWLHAKKWAYDIAAVILFGTAGDAESADDGDAALVNNEEYAVLFQLFTVWLSGFSDMDANNAKIPGTALYDGLAAREKLLPFLWEIVLRGKQKKEAGELHEDSVMYQLLSIPESEISKEELLDVIMLVFGAAHDTTSTSLCNLFYIFYTYPQEAQKLRAEFAEYAPEEISYDVVQSNKYLECFVKETMRLLPVVYGIPKQLLKDEVVADYRLPKDSVVTIDMVSLSRNENMVGENADTFDPTRFMVNNISHSAFSPFGLGSKMCLGWKLAYLELKVMCIMLATKCKIELDESRLVPATYSHLYLYDIWTKVRRAEE